MPSTTTTTEGTDARSNENVFLFIPNLIGEFFYFIFLKSKSFDRGGPDFGNLGYTRIFLASLSLYYMPWHPKVCVTLYCISCLLDAVDGNAARYYNQCKFNFEVENINRMVIEQCVIFFLGLQVVNSVLY